MRKFILWSAITTLILLTLSLFPLNGVSAHPSTQTTITTPSQLIDAVNNLRLSYGLRTLAVHPLLMQSAQSQADYMASIGQITHVRPGGITFTQQLLGLGFPLSGDLSLGGFRAENILMNSDPLVWDGVPIYWQDPDHMNTMLSQNFTNIGAGISQGSDGYYYALDCAAVTGSGQMQGSAASILTKVPGTDTAGGNSLGISQYMVPVVMSTAMPNGDVRHKVQYGQSLWSIAIKYGTTIRQIQALNNLGGDSTVYQGQVLLVQKGATQPAPATPTALPKPTITSTQSPTAIIPSIIFPTQLLPTQIPTLEKTSSKVDAGSSQLLVGILIIAAFVGGGVAVWLIRDPN
jgi:uncharacterized protein YkwD/LysM repeat protein